MFSRRDIVALPLVVGACSVTPQNTAETLIATPSRAGNPLRLPAGVCDPQVRVWDNVAWLYATHDASPENTTFTMNDWQVWRSTNLIDWELANTLRPEQTYFGRPSTQCWATDAARSNGLYYLYFSMGPEDIGVVVSENADGPWRDALGRALIAKDQFAPQTRDPGILQDAGGANYIVFGTFDFLIAKLGDDMISLAEAPRRIDIRNAEGPYGLGRTDDKPFLHRRGDIYYLSWGSFYATGSSPYGPFDCKGPLFLPEFVEQSFLDDSAMRGPYAPPPQYRPSNWLNFDRHGSFFEWRGQWYFACNDQSQPGTSPLFRRSILCNVNYRDNGEIEPLSLTRLGAVV